MPASIVLVPVLLLLLLLMLLLLLILLMMLPAADVSWLLGVCLQAHFQVAVGEQWTRLDAGVADSPMMIHHRRVKLVKLTVPPWIKRFIFSNKYETSMLH